MLTTAYGAWCSGSTLGTLERCQRPVPMRPSKLKLVLDASSAGGEHAVILDVLQTRTRTRNTCNVKTSHPGPPRAGPRRKGSGGNFFGRSRRARDAHARVPSTAASDTAQACRPDGSLLARRLQGPIKTRCKTREAFQHSRYMRPTTLVNLRRSTRRAGKVEQMSRAIGLTPTTHLSYMPSEHPFMLDLASSPLTKLPCSPPRTNRAFGRLAGKW